MENDVKMVHIIKSVENSVWNPRNLTEYFDFDSTNSFFY